MSVAVTCDGCGKDLDNEFPNLYLDVPTGQPHDADYDVVIKISQWERPVHFCEDCAKPFLRRLADKYA